MKRNLLYALGGVVLLISFWYLGNLLSEYWHTLAKWEITDSRIAILVGAASGYVIALLWQAEAWHRVLVITSNIGSKRHDSYVSILSSQIIKYFPLGVFHLAGRHVWLNRKGHRHADLARATVLETILMVAGALMLGGGLGLFSLHELPAAIDIWRFSLPMAVVMGGGFVAGLILLLLPSVGLIRGFERGRAKKILLAQGLLVLFFLLQSSVFLMCYSVAGNEALTFSMVPVFLLSWLAGYVVIGAPGGLGVREAVFLLVGGTLVPVDEALLAILIFRVVAIVGEVVVFFLGGGLKFSQRS